MVATFISLAEPSQIVIGLVIVWLLVILIAGHHLDYEGSPVKNFISYLNTFTSPLLVLFALIVIVRIISIVA